MTFIESKTSLGIALLCALRNSSFRTSEATNIVKNGFPTNGMLLLEGFKFIITYRPKFTQSVTKSLLLRVASDGSIIISRSVVLFKFIRK